MGEQSQEILNLASAAGHLLLENGAEISRVEETMERIAEHYGEDKENFFVLSNGIFTTGKSYANVEFIPIKGVRLDKVVEVNQLSREIAYNNLSIEEAHERLDRIRQIPAKPVWQQLAAAAVGSAAFCAIFGGSLLDCAASCIAGLTVYLLILLASGRIISKMLSNICGGLAGACACLLFQWMGFGVNLGNMIIGALIPLIPGVAFTNGLRDMANEDYIAGATRLLDALLVFFCIALGASLAFILQRWASGSIVILNGMTIDPVTSMLPIQMAAAFTGTAAFAIIYGVPDRFCLTAGAVGMAGWLVYMVCLRAASLNPVEGTFFAALTVAILARGCAVWKKCPSTVFLICGIFPLIPGAGVFWSSYYIVSEQWTAALGAGFTAIKVTIAIVLAILIATNVFHHGRK